MSIPSSPRRKSALHCHFRADAEPAPAGAAVPLAARARPAVLRFIEAHRELGHRAAGLDPCGEPDPQGLAALQPGLFGLAPTDRAGTDGFPVLGAWDVAALDRRLKAVYCGALALDAGAVRDEARRAWLHARIEAPAAAPVDGLALLDRLVRVQTWEWHVARVLPQAKRFSLEGCEALVPLIDALLEHAAGGGIADVFLGMAHRGRVNVLANVLGVAPAELLAHLGDDGAPAAARHDLVYHRGGRRTLHTPRGPLALTLAHNPSHLESVYPVVLGRAHANAQHRGATLAVVVHGDAAFAGQGVVMETLALSRRPGYDVGGTVHVILDNQVGFTEPNRMDPQAPRYCTDVTRMVDAPVLRVNADHPEQVLRAAEIALAWRARFASDVVIDLVGYRRPGHSEHDVPALTDPARQALVARQGGVVAVHARALEARGLASRAELEARIAAGRAATVAAFEGGGAGAPAQAEDDPVPPRVAAPTPDWLRDTVAALTDAPQGFRPHALVQAAAARWRDAAADPTLSADWRLAEALACAGALQAGVPVRISGMDVQRGTFMHRHAVWHDQSPDAAGATFVPLQGLASDAARFEVVNSILSEAAVLGFEYGRSVQAPRSLVLWEAQFGDFVNGAQVVVDQYIAGGERKWGHRCALTVLLPHGHEGVGPEHSSAHLNRFLDLCADDNLRVACPSTSVQWFRLLRRQALAAQRKPLVALTPKGTLYAEPAAQSPLREFLDGDFRPVLDDEEVEAWAASRAVLCSGKLYYDLLRGRQALGAGRVALLRLEQFHPFPHDDLARVLARYPGLRTLVWAQEEQRNQGAWNFVRDELAARCPARAVVALATRPATAAGATASAALHRREQDELVARALGGGDSRR